MLINFETAQTFEKLDFEIFKFAKRIDFLVNLGTALNAN